MVWLNSRIEYLNTRLDNFRRQLEKQQAAVAGIAAEGATLGGAAAEGATLSGAAADAGAADAEAGVEEVPEAADVGAGVEEAPEAAVVEEAAEAVVAADLDEVKVKNELAQVERDLKKNVKEVYARRLKAWVSNVNKQSQRHEEAATEFVSSFMDAENSSSSGNNNFKQMQANIAKMKSAVEILKNMKTEIRMTKKMVNDRVKEELNKPDHNSSM